MKKNKYSLKKIAKTMTIAVFALAFVACTDNFEDLNTNPYEVNTADLSIEAQLIKPLTYVYAPHQNMFQFYTNLSVDLFGGYFMTPHNFGGGGNADYKLNQGFCGGVYENFYLNIFNTTSSMIPICTEKELTDYAAVLRIFQAYAAIVATDSYGPMPFKSVLDKSETISYDSQKDIYTYLFEDLDKAINEIKQFTASNPSDERKAGLKKFDYWCDGDHAKWIKVANTLKLRMAIRLSKVEPALAKTKAEEAVASGVLTNADTDILINKNLSNEMWRMFAWQDCGMNASLVTMLTGYEDPRLPLFLTKNTGDVTEDTGKKDAEDKPILKVLVPKGTLYVGVRAGCSLPNKPNAWVNYSGMMCRNTRRCR